MSDQYLGEIRIFAGNFAPSGWALCNGQVLPISQNTALFSLLGTTYGGNGSSTFALPNLQGLAPIMQGQGPGLSQRVLGETGGETAVTLQTSQMGAHNHSVNCFAGAGTQLSPTAAYWANDGVTRGALVYAAAGAASMNPAAFALSAGPTQPHNNMQPFLVLTFIIAMQGIYPTRG
jgi:microcystin-dependent protein